MKTMLLVTAAVLFAAATFARAQERARQDVSSPAERAAAAGKPDTCVPKQKNPERHQQFMKDKEEALRKGPIQLVWIGDSITDAWRQKGSPQNSLFVERWGRYNPLNLGISGDKTEHVLWRLENGELDGLADGAKLAVIMIGTNNLGNKPTATPHDTAEGIKCIVQKVREKLPNTKILLLGVFPRGREPNNPFREQIKTVNQSIQNLSEPGKVKYLDISDALLDDNGVLPADVMPDQLHPNPKGYQIWADAVDPVIRQMIGGE